MCQECIELDIIYNWLKFTTEGIANQWGYPKPKIYLNNRISHALGRCWIEDEIIEYGTKYVRRNKKEIVVALIKHEICHLKHPEHDDNFVIACNEMGITPHTDQMYKITGVGNYYYRCPTCKNIEAFSRHPKWMEYCTKCTQGENYIYLEYMGTDKELFNDKNSILYEDIVKNKKL